MPVVRAGRRRVGLSQCERSRQHVIREEALNRIEASRRYTLNLLSDIPPADWFRMPARGGHARRLAGGPPGVRGVPAGLERIRGPRPEDVELFPPTYHALFGRDSVPQADAALYPPVEEIRRVLDGIHRQVQTEVGGMDDASLNVPTSSPHRIFSTKLGALEWCAQPRDGPRRPDRSLAPIVWIAAAVVRVPPGAPGFRVKKSVGSVALCGRRMGGERNFPREVDLRVALALGVVEVDRVAIGRPNRRQAHASRTADAELDAAALAPAGQSDL